MTVVESLAAGSTVVDPAASDPMVAVVAGIAVANTAAVGIRDWTESVGQRIAVVNTPSPIEVGHGNVAAVDSSLEAERIEAERIEAERIAGDRIVHFRNRRIFGPYGFRSLDPSRRQSNHPR